MATVVVILMQLPPLICLYPKVSAGGKPTAHTPFQPTTTHLGLPALPYLASMTLLRAPQQTTEPSALTPQVCHPPVLTEANSPSGGVDWPSKLPYRSSLSPQQATEPSALTPQVCPPPALTEANSPSGGVAWLTPGQGQCESRDPDEQEPGR